jgi:Transposase DDE domain group 1
MEARPMPTDCNATQLVFEGFEGRQVVGAFDGGAVTSNAGATLLREADRAIGLTGRVARCFRDERDPDLVVHRMETLVAQRVHAIALGYEDINDHDELRHDPVLGLLSDTLEPKRADVATLAGKSTLNRLEHGLKSGASRYRKISVIDAALAQVFLDIYVAAHKAAPKCITLDLDATDDPLHGNQEGRFYHGYYRCYCYLPLYIFDGHHLLVAKLRQADRDASAGAMEEVARVVAHVRAAWPQVEIRLRADSGFARDDLMSWCEENRVDYVFGLARNKRLEAMIAGELAEAKAMFAATDKAARVFKEFDYRTRDSWSRSRRVVAKAEHLKKGANPRFIVTSLPAERIGGQELYEQIYCARGEMENRIKECQLDLYADRTSAATMRANQLRLWLASLAYVLMEAVRRLALEGTQLANATAGSIRLKLLKIGAVVTLSVRRIKLAFASACPAREPFTLALDRLRRLPTAIAA